MATAGGRGDRAWRLWVGCSVVLLMLVPVVVPRTYYTVYLDSKGAIMLCLPHRVFLPDTYLRLPKVYCAQVCDTNTAFACTTFRYVDSECHLYRLTLTSGYSMIAEEPNALQFYHALDHKDIFPYPDLALHAAVTAESNYWTDLFFEKHLTYGALCNRHPCPCTFAAGHSVTVDLGAPHFVKEVHVITSYPPQNHSENFIAYLGDAQNMKRKEYTFGKLQAGTSTFVFCPNDKVQFITFTKKDNRLCLCLVQVFDKAAGP